MGFVDRIFFSLSICVLLMWPHYYGDLWLKVVQWFQDMIGNTPFELPWSIFIWMGWMITHGGIWLNMFYLSCGMRCWSYVLSNCGLLFSKGTLHNPVALSLSLVKIIFLPLWCGNLCVWRLLFTLNHTFSRWISMECVLVYGPLLIVRVVVVIPMCIL